MVDKSDFPEAKNDGSNGCVGPVGSRAPKQGEVSAHPSEPLTNLDELSRNDVKGNASFHKGPGRCVMQVHQVQFRFVISPPGWELSTVHASVCNNF